MPRTKATYPIERLTVMTQAEVARCLGISTMRVCQLERSALAKLKIAFQKEWDHAERMSRCARFQSAA